MRNIQKYLNKINESKNLQDLLSNIKTASQELDEAEFKCIDTSRFPTFGGVTPEDTSEIYSWDETHILISNDWKIIPRYDA